MNNKKIKFNSDAQKLMLEGITELYQAVSSTLGPNGNTVIIDRYGLPYITKDGVTVAKEIKFKNPYKNMGAQIVTEAAITTVNEVGDGTTTSVILTYKLINQLLNNSSKESWFKTNGESVKNKIIDYIKSQSIDIKNDLVKIKQVATVSANNDESIGALVQEAFSKTGEDTVVLVEESKNYSTSVEVINGIQLDKGYAHPNFINDHNNCTLENCFVLVTNTKLNSIKELEEILTFVHSQEKSLLLIFQDYDPVALEVLKLNAKQKTLNMCAIYAPEFGDYRVNSLQDIAIATGATFINHTDISNFTVDHLGRVDKVISNKNNTLLIGITASKEDIQTRINNIKELNTQIDPTSEYIIDHNKKRIAKLSGGMAVIKVGGTTELEMKERKDRVDDAVAATKAAIIGGVVAGGGVTLKDAYNTLNSTDKKHCEFLLEPIKHINPNYDISKFDRNFGINLLTNTPENLLESGIIDPSNTTIAVIENAFSIAKLFLNSKTVIVPDE